MSEVTRESIAKLKQDTNRALPSANAIVTAWGGAVRIVGLSNDAMEDFQRESLQRSRRKKKDPSVKIRVVARLLIATVRDMNDNAVFTAADEDWLGSLSPAELDRPWMIAAKLCGLDAEEDNDAGN